MINLSDLDFEFDLRIRHKGKIVLDYRTARLIYYVGKFGKILMASKALSIPYSEALFLIKRAEKALGVKLIVRGRGGARRGYAVLTPEARRILDVYASVLGKFNMSLEGQYSIPAVGDLVIIGSDDPVLRELVGLFSGDVPCEYHVVGSLLGIFHIVLGDSDIVVAHLYDPETTEYNVPYVRRLGLENEVHVFRGFIRTLVLAAKKLSCDDPTECLMQSRKLATRGRGSGTYHYLRYLVGDRINTMTILPTRTHEESARLVANDIADLCVTTLREATRYGLDYIELKAEFFDFLIPRDRIEKESAQRFLDFLKENSDLINNHLGYTTPENFLRRIL